MTYPCEWEASTDPEVESGTATFKVEGATYTICLDSFKDFGKVSRMLDMAFGQGKVFAAKAMRAHLERSLDDAEREHGLT